MEDEHIADFIKYYRENTENEESYKAYWKLNKEYLAENARLQSQHGTPLQSLNLNMNDIRKSKTVDTTNARHTNREDFKDKADRIARQHGFKGASFDEHLKQKDKEASHKHTGKETASPTPAVPKQESKKAEALMTDREIKHQKFLEEIRQTTERNRDQNRERDR